MFFSIISYFKDTSRDILRQISRDKGILSHWKCNEAVLKLFHELAPSYARIHWKRKPAKRLGKEKMAGVSFNFRLCPKIVKAISLVICTASSRKIINNRDQIEIRRTKYCS